MRFIKHAKNDAILVKCETGKAKERMKQEMLRKMGKQYHVEETKIRNPIVKIVNMEWKPQEIIAHDTIIEAVYNQNELLEKEKDEVKVKLVKQTKDKKPFLTLVCNGSAHKKLV